MDDNKNEANFTDTESGREEVSYSYEGLQQEESARLLGRSKEAIVSG